MNGKEICNTLKVIRMRIAAANGIPLEFEPCAYAGDDCPGTCPRCEEELRQLSEGIQAIVDPVSGGTKGRTSMGTAESAFLAAERDCTVA